MGEYLLSRIHTLYLFLGILHGVQILASFDLCLVIIGIKCRHDKGKDHNYNNNEEADHSNLILTKSAEAILPEAHALTHDDLALLLFFIRRHKIIRFIFYMKAHSIRFFHRYLPSCSSYFNLILGSTSLYTISTSTFMTTISVARKMVVPMIMV